MRARQFLAVAALSAFVVASPAPAAAQVGAQGDQPPAAVKVDFYEVQGEDHASLFASMMSGRPSAGRTESQISFDYEARPEGGACRPTSVTTRLAITMTMPRWTPPAGASSELIGRWQRFIDALQLHEDGHVELIRSHDASLRFELMAVSAPDCLSLRAAMKSRFNQLVEKARAAHLEYDQQTGHGKTQNAVFR